MRCHLDFELGEGLAFPLGEDELLSLCEAVLELEGVCRPCYVSLSVVDDEEIRRLNAQWRGVDRATDVISLECERPDDPELGLDEPCELGDIVLAAAYVEAQARAFGTTFADECRLLVVHGLLHLLGYDHMEEADAHEMQRCEERVLADVATDGTLTDVVLTRHREEESA
jgi:probable rRNA maturation factor